jgi:hypothetical protein
MRVVLSACTNKAFLCGPMPLARLKLRPLIAMNDNNAVFSPPKGCHPFHGTRAAYGRAEFIIAVLAAVAGIIALPLLQGLAVPVMTASEVAQGSPQQPNRPYPSTAAGQRVRWPS